MQKIIGLLGYVDKSEFVINLAKAMRVMGKKILVVDSTLEQYYKYTIPSIDKGAKSTVTDFDGVDYAIGFEGMESIKEYLCTTATDVSQYDYVFLDIDNPKGYNNYCKEKFDKYYFFIEHSMASISRNEMLVTAIQDLNEAKERPEYIKVIFQHYISRASKKLFEAKIDELNVVWKDEEYVFTYSEQDQIADLETEFSGYVDFTRHTKQYMELVTDIASEILGDYNAGYIRKAIKDYSRRKF